MRNLVMLAVVLLLGGLARANGGPVAWTKTSPMGGVNPVKVSEVSLVSEDLAIALLDDGNRYRVSAKYVLSNPGAPWEVDFGVPIKVFGRTLPGNLYNALPVTTPGAPKRPTPTLRDAVAGEIEIHLEGVKQRCVMAESTDPPVKKPCKGSTNGSCVHTYFEEPTGWCVAHLTIPSGEAVALSLAYVADLDFYDIAVSKSVFNYQSERSLRYLLFPAWHWAGEPKRVHLEVETGAAAGHVTAQPAPSSTEGPKLVWDLGGKQATSTKELALEIRAEQLVRHHELIKADWWDNRNTAKASSAATGHAAPLAVDKDGATAWCEGKSGPGAGEWVEITYPPMKGCRPIAFVLVPGDAKDQESYVSRGRVKALRLGPCGSSAKGEVIKLPPGDPAFTREKGHEYEGTDGSVPALSDHYARSAMVLFPKNVPEKCARLTILEVAKGSASEDTCLSEFRAVVDCR